MQNSFMWNTLTQLFFLLLFSILFFWYIFLLSCSFVYFLFRRRDHVSFLHFPKTVQCLFSLTVCSFLVSKFWHMPHILSSYGHLHLHISNIIIHTERMRWAYLENVLLTLVGTTFVKHQRSFAGKDNALYFGVNTSCYTVEGSYKSNNKLHILPPY